jgi:hypothetical protein
MLQLFFALYKSVLISYDRFNQSFIIIIVNKKIREFLFYHKELVLCIETLDYAEGLNCICQIDIKDQLLRHY